MPGRANTPPRAAPYAVAKTGDEVMIQPPSTVQPTSA